MEEVFDEQLGGQVALDLLNAGGDGEECDSEFAHESHNECGRECLNENEAESDAANWNELLSICWVPPH
jgi:hypothetical protein